MSQLALRPEVCMSSLWQIGHVPFHPRYPWYGWCTVWKVTFVLLSAMLWPRAWS